MDTAATLRTKNTIRWYTVQIKPNSYNLAKRNLQNQGIKTFFPKIEVTKRNQTKFSTGLKPLFPGYLFISFDKNSLNWSKINNTIGVTRILVNNREPCELPFMFVDSLLSRCDEAGTIRTKEKYMLGEQVRFLKGPFSKMVAVIEDIGPQDRITLLFNFMGLNTKTVVKAAEIMQSSK